MKTAVLLLLLFSSVLAFAAELKLPEKVGELEFAGRKDYDTAEAGYSLRYQHGELLKADVYVYNKASRGWAMATTHHWSPRS